MIRTKKGVVLSAHMTKSTINEGDFTKFLHISMMTIDILLSEV